ncbi:MAG: AAA family ATPase, partial [Bdellovibrionaceae bacterium]|nr:AAA family ATPase [Pseudobdellovibrionaceae bacterium]
NMEQKLNEEVLQKWDAIFEKTQEKATRISDGEDPKGYFLEIKIKQGSDIYSIGNRSLGFRWFFSFLIFTAFRKSRSVDKGETLFLLDEPASNLHYRSQQKLLDSLKNTFSDCKLIYSTHSPHLINPKWLAGTYIVKNKAIDYDNPEEGKTDISIDSYKNFAAQYPDQEYHFKPILDALDYVPSKLELVPSLIFTEGKNDYYTFRYIAKVIFNSEYKLNFYPGAGANSYEYIFRLYIGWNRKFIALFDSDETGEKEKNRYIESIGCDLENKIFTLMDINSEWKNSTTENLFPEKERIRIIQTCYEDHKTYKKKEFNLAIEHLYISETKFDLSKETINKFRSIFEFLKDKLND